MRVTQLSNTRIAKQRLQPTREPTRYTIIYWVDPFLSYDGGIETYVHGLVRHAPRSAVIELVGITHQPDVYPLGVWATIIVANREVLYLPIVARRAHASKGLLPMSLRFTLALALRKGMLRPSVRLVQKLEPLVALSTRSPTVLFQHVSMDEAVSNPSGTRWRLLSRVYRHLEARLLPRVEHICCVNEADRDRLCGRYPQMSRRVVFQPTWFEPTIFYLPCPATRRLRRSHVEGLLNADGKSLVGVFVGRLEQQKNIDVLVAACAMLRAQGIDFRMLLVGDGSLRAHIEKQITEAALDEAVVCTGWLPPWQIAALLHGSDCFLLSSFYEGMCIALLEAQACGLPAIITRVGEACRTVTEEETGLLVNDPTAHAFSTLR